MKIFDEVRFSRVPDPPQGVVEGDEGVVVEFAQGEGLSVMVELHREDAEEAVVFASPQDLEVTEAYHGEYDD